MFLTACSGVPDTPCISSGSQVLASRSFDASDWPIDLIGMATLYTCFHLGAYFALLAKSYKK